MARPAAARPLVCPAAPLARFLAALADPRACGIRPAGRGGSLCSSGRCSWRQQRHGQTLAAAAGPHRDAARAAAAAAAASATEPQPGREPTAPGAPAAAAAAAVEAAARPAAAAEQPSPDPPHWVDWRIGVALAGASFEAYGGLSEAGLAQHTPAGAEIHYTDSEFLRRKMAGLLEVSIERAVALPAADPAPFTSDPYLTVAVGDSQHTTRTILNNLNPEWHERCTLFVRDPGVQALSVQAFDSDIGSEDDFLGSASVDLLAVCDGQPHELQLQLEGSPFVDEDVEEGSGGDGSGDRRQGSDGPTGGGSGSVRLTCRFVPFAELLAGEAAPTVDGRPLLASPGEVPLKADWRSLLDLAGVAAHAMFTPVAFVENATTNTQAWLHWNPGRREACLAFRGTEQAKWRDYMTDLHLVPAPLDPDRVAAAPRHAELARVSAPPQEPGTLQRILSNVEAAKEQVAAERQAAEEAAGSADQAERSIISTAVQAVTTTAEEVAVLERVKRQIEAGEAEEGGHADQPWVHSGFLSAFDSVRPAALSLLAALLAGEQQQWRIFLTGHSLGGALATLCAWDCAHRNWGCQESPELVVYSFGAPRVGNRPWAEHYNELVPSTWRIVNERDSVATVPRLMGYAHVGHAVMLKSGGEAEVETHTTQRMGEGLGVADITPAVGAVVAAKVPEMLPDLATKALAKVGIEVAAAGSADEAAVVAEASASLDAAPEGSRGGSGGEAAQAAAVVAAVTPDTLPDWWQQEVEAWTMLLDGSALNEHMEPLYLENLKRYLEALAQEGREQGEGGPGGAAAAAVEAASPAASSADCESS